jgi:hypothetical protein
VPAADSPPANPFKAQIEQARKEWADLGKPKGEEAKPKEAEAAKEQKPAPAGDGYRKIMDAKNAAIKRAKEDTLRLEEKIKGLESEYSKFMDSEDTAAAASAKAKSEAYLEELADSQAAERVGKSFGGFMDRAAAEGTIRDPELFAELAEHYVPLLGANPAIAQVIQSCKYPFATLELLLSAMANQGWKPELLVNAALPSLRMWIGDAGRQAETIVEKTEAAPASPPVNVPASVVATTSSDQGGEPALKTERASMEDIIRHVRRYGGRGLG